MREVRRILVGVRNPEARRLAAVDKAAQLARAFDAEIELFHALRSEGAERGRVKSRLEKVAQRLRDDLISTATHVSLDYPPGEALVRRARAIGADLIVADCHSGDHSGAWLLHLTDWDLLRYSPLPVLLVKSKQRYQKPCLLAAVDPIHAIAVPAKLDAEILETAAAFRKALSGTLHAVHAYVPVPGDAKPGELLNPDATHILERRARQHASARLAPVLKNMSVARSARHLLGEHPINGIPRLARRIHADIVVMGAVSRSGLKRVFIGNTAERMLDELDCDVLVVKPPGFVSALPLANRPRTRPTRSAPQLVSVRNA